MTMSTFAAGLIIVAVTATLELLNKENERKADEFLRFE